jgi:hypothetical protein
MIMLTVGGCGGTRRIMGIMRMMYDDVRRPRLLMILAVCHPIRYWICRWNRLRNGHELTRV